MNSGSYIGEGLLGVKADLFSFLIPQLRERLRQEAHQVRRHQRILADGLAGQVPRQSMQIDSKSGCFKRIAWKSRATSPASTS